MDDFQLFKTNYDAADLKIGFDDARLTDDDVAQMACTIWDYFSNVNTEGNIDAFVIFEEFLELLSETNKGFVYELFVENSGKCNDCLWQTAVMHKNMETFGSFLSMDAMKRICLGAEGTVVPEYEEAYQAMICFALKNALKCTPEEVYVVTADGFCNQKMVTEVLGLLT
eukprot:12649235-Ditylum_brightwellii.AAC.1